MLPNFFLLLFLIISNLIVLSSCKIGTNIKSNADTITIVTPLSSPVPLIENLKDAEQITFIGDNHYPSISEDNTKILFASRQRVQHKDFQIYQLNLSQIKEERLIFTDGSAIDPVYGENSSHIYFSSSTDEIKDFQNKTETPHPFTLPFSFSDPIIVPLNLEIYSLSLTNKKSIPSRLTEHSGYDSNPQYLLKNDFAWVQKSQIDFKLLKWTGKNQKTLEIFKQTNPIWKPSWNQALSRWAWISWNIENPINSTNIFTSNQNSEKIEALTLPEGIYHDVSWLPGENRLIFSAKLSQAKDYDIYVFDLNNQCLRSLITYSGDDIEPVINKKSSFLVFSHRQSGSNNGSFQLYKKNLSYLQEACLKTTN